MFVGFSQNLGNGLRIYLGTRVKNSQPSTKDTDRQEFLVKVNQALQDIWREMSKRANISYEVFAYVTNINTSIDISEVVKETNLNVFAEIGSLTSQICEMIQKAEFANTLTASTKEKITNLLFEAKNNLQQIEYESDAENKILNKIAQAENKKIEQVKKDIRKFEAQRQPQEKSPIIALLLGIFLGWAGMDRFYKGDMGLGILKLLTFGGAVIWWICDLFIVPSQIKQGNYSYFDKLQKILFILLLIIFIPLIFSLATQTRSARQAAEANTTIQSINN